MVFWIYCLKKSTFSLWSLRDLLEQNQIFMDFDHTPEYLIFLLVISRQVEKQFKIEV